MDDGFWFLPFTPSSLLLFFFLTLLFFFNFGYFGFLLGAPAIWSIYPQSLSNEEFIRVAVRCNGRSNAMCGVALLVGIGIYYFWV